VRGVLLGAWGSAESAALESIIKSTFPKIYGSNWLQNLRPLSLAQVSQILRAAMYYYSLGYSTQDYKAFFRNIQKSFPDILPLNVTKVLAFISGIDPARYPSDIALLKTGIASKAAMEQQKELSSEESKAAMAYEIQDKINRGAGAIASAGYDAAKTINAALPWYLKPTTLIPVALVGLGVFYFIQAKGAAKILRPLYKSNPIDKSEIKRSAANKTYEMFHDQKPKKIKSIKRIDTEELVELGNALELGYASKKWTGKKANYLHKIGKGVKVMCTPDRKTLVIHGGQMEIKDVGIIN